MYKYCLTDILKGAKKAEIPFGLVIFALMLMGRLQLQFVVLMSMVKFITIERICSKNVLQITAVCQ